MPKKDVISIIDNHSNPFVNKMTSEKEIVLHVSIGFTRYCFLWMEFKDGKLNYAGIRGEIGETDTFEDSPKDIGKRIFRDRTYSF